jgi:hypothetical protein
LSSDVHSQAHPNLLRLFLADGDAVASQEKEPIVLRQAGVAEIRTLLENKLTSTDVERLQLKYEDEGRLPAAAIVCVDGFEFRLEKDHFDGCWTIATNEGDPRLLDRLEESQLASRMLLALEQSVAQLRT